MTLRLVHCDLAWGILVMGHSGRGAFRLQSVKTVIWHDSKTVYQVLTRIVTVSVQPVIVVVTLLMSTDTYTIMKIMQFLFFVSIAAEVYVIIPTHRLQECIMQTCISQHNLNIYVEILC